MIEAIVVAIIAILIIIFIILMLSRRSSRVGGSSECCVDLSLCKRIDRYLKDTQRDTYARGDPDGVLGSAKWNYILPGELYEKYRAGELAGDNSPVVLDVRRPEDYARGHIPGAINIFWLNLMEENNICRLAKLTRGRQLPIIVVCYVGHTSSQTLVLLRLLGFKAISLKYGMGTPPGARALGLPEDSPESPRAGWKDLGYPVVFQ